MIVVRSWPKDAPINRDHVQDRLPRLVMERYDYTPLAGIADDVLLLEWDVALDRTELARFAARALATPDRVLVAPYRLYGVHGAGEDGVWCHRLLLDAPINSCSTTQFTRWVEEGEPECDYFSFGAIYLPHELVVAFLAAPSPQRGRSPLLAPDAPYSDDRLHDQTFSVWHRHYGPCRPVPIAWDIHPQHLHG